MGIASLVLGGAGLVNDIIGGGRAQREQKRLFDEFRKNLAITRENNLALERISRGELRVSLGNARELFKNSIAALSAEGSASSRRSLELIQREIADQQVRDRQRGIQGSSQSAVNESRIAREAFRASLDAEAGRNRAIAEAQASLAGFEVDATQALNASRRNEAQIQQDFTNSLNRALENTRVVAPSTAEGLSTLGAELDDLFDKGGGGLVGLGEVTIDQARLAGTTGAQAAFAALGLGFKR